MSARLKIIQGVSAAFNIELLDADGLPYSYEQLQGVVVEIGLRADPLLEDVARFSSADATHVSIVASRSAVIWTLWPVDTSPLSLGTYFYEVRINFTNGAVLVPVEWSPADVGLGGAADPPAPVFANTVKLDHDYGLSDDLRYMTPGGSPIENAQVRVYLKTDYDARRLSTPIGVTTTNAFGRWTQPILVTAGTTYVVQFFKPNEYGPDVKTVTTV